MAVVLATLVGCLSADQQAGLDLLNRDRREANLRAVKDHAVLKAKAQAWAERLARENKLYHSTLSAGVPSCWRGLGENIGYGSSIAAVQDAYMDSPGHRANIMNGTFDWAAVGVAHRGNRVFTVQVFMDGC